MPIEISSAVEKTRCPGDGMPTVILDNKEICPLLTNVDQDTGAMEYLRSSLTGVALLTELKPLLGVNITDRKLAEFRANGYQRYRLAGKSGTAVFYDDNIVHKANIPTRGYRDAIFINMAVHLST